MTALQERGRGREMQNIGAVTSFVNIFIFITSWGKLVQRQLQIVPFASGETPQRPLHFSSPRHCK